MISSLSKILTIPILALGMSSASASVDLGNISFVGDSITQGGGDSKNNANSYRYSLWKCFVDNNASFSPVGSMNMYWDGKTTNSKAPNYMGQVFDNTSEGHYGWTTNQLLNGLQGENRPNTGSGQASDWIAALQANGKVPDTLTFMIGINDLSKKANPNQMLDDLGDIIQAYQEANPLVTIHVFSVLPTNQSWQTSAGYTSSDAYDTMLSNKVSEWNTTNSKVVYHDVRVGFSPTKHTTDNVHPNEQGNLIIAGNMARALELEQRTMGLERKSSTDLDTQISFTPGQKPTQDANHFIVAGDTTCWDFATTQQATINATGKASYLQGSWNTKPGGGEFTLDFSLNLESKNDSAQYFTIWLGNGLVSDGMLKIFENKISWGYSTETVLYEANMTNTFNDFRIVYMNASQENSITAGYYIWMNGQLIGEALQGEVGQKNDRFILGSFTNRESCYADIKNISYDNQRAFAPPSKSISEQGAPMITLAALALLAIRKKIA